MDFAEKQLQKHGWKSGEGLGRERSGITEAIKVKIKNDNKGVGHDAGQEFTYHWWDHVFNKAASNIHVTESKECVFEDFKLKHGVMAEAERFVRPSAILASSTGNIFPSRLSEGLKLKERIIVAHPLNPPHLVPLVEIIPAPWTAADVTSNARRLLASVGQELIVARKETAGFIICRVQHAITAECFKLIRDDVVSVDDLDKLMPHGLGLRYAFLGALETSYLNANGIEHFCNMYGDAIYELQEQSGPPIRLEGATLQTIQQQIEQRIPLDKIDERRQWRDERLAELYRLKNKKSSE